MKIKHRKELRSFHITSSRLHRVLRRTVYFTNKQKFQTGTRQQFMKDALPVLFSSKPNRRVSTGRAYNLVWRIFTKWKKIQSHRMCHCQMEAFTVILSCACTLLISSLKQTWISRSKRFGFASFNYCARLCVSCESGNTGWTPYMADWTWTNIMQHCYWFVHCKIWFHIRKLFRPPVGSHFWSIYFDVTATFTLTVATSTIVCSYTL
jgi:hypothetical protein